MKYSDSKEIEDLYLEYSPKLYSVCWQVVGYDSQYDDLIDDCVQETFVTLTNQLKSLYDHPSIEGWLVVTCRHRLFSELKKNKKYSAFLIDRELDDVPNPLPSDIDQWIDDETVGSKKEQVLSLLNDRQKTVFLKYTDGCHSVKEMASETGMSESAIRSVMTRIRKKIRKSGIF